MKKFIPFIIFTFLTAFSYSHEDSDIIEKALSVRQKAYCPYSNYKVGAALKTKSGKIFVGANVENASYGMTNCAERSAVFAAVSSGERAIDSIAIVTKDGGSPCGSCRQVLNEFNPEMKILLINENGAVKKECKLSDLLVDAFGPKNLK